MFGSLSGEGPSSPAGRGVTSPGPDSQESSWIGLWSVVSRPALSFLQRRLLGRPGPPSGGSAFEENEFLRQLEVLMPGPGQALQAPGAGDGRDPDQVRYFTSTLLSPVGLNSGSSQDMKPAGGPRWGPERRGAWWGSLWGLGPQPLGAETKAPAAGRPGVFGESTGPPQHKETAHNNTAQNTGGSTADPRISIRNHLSCSGAPPSSEEPPPTTEQDQGYSSLEEEQVHMRTEGQGTEPPTGGAAEGEQEEAQQRQETVQEEVQEEVQGPAPPHPQCQNKAIAFIMGCPCSDDDDGQSDDEASDEDGGFDSEGSTDASSSEDEDEDEDEDDEDDEDDDDEEEEEEEEEEDSSGGEVDTEAERLWSSLCHSLDPYNPRNFTALLQTCPSSPRTAPPSSQTCPTSSPNPTPLPLTSSSSPAPSPGLDGWDDSTSASDGEEAENLLLWSSFSCSSDPYSPLNFQAPLRTRGPNKSPGARKGPPHTDPVGPPEYKKEEAEERLDSGFSEPSSSSTSSSSSCSSTSHKKVRFCDHVEEIFISAEEEEEEDRRGPWEELARDRCRFLRRCQEVEQSIGYCLQPQHRSRVSHRLSLLCSSSSSAPPVLPLCSSSSAPPVLPLCSSFTAAPLLARCSSDT